MRVRSTLTYGSGGPGLNTIYWSPAGAVAVSADAADAVARVRAFWLAIAGVFASTMTIQVQSDVTRINPADGTLQGTLSPTAPASVVGTLGTAIGPIAAMALMRLRTNQIINNRQLRGRWYLGPISTGTVTASGVIGSSLITTMNNAATAMLTGGATSSAPVVWHRPPSAGLGIAAPVNGCSAWDQVAVLRSRRDA